MMFQRRASPCHVLFMLLKNHVLTVPDFYLSSKMEVDISVFTSAGTVEAACRFMCSMYVT